MSKCKYTFLAGGTEVTVFADDLAKAKQQAAQLVDDKARKLRGEGANLELILKKVEETDVEGQEFTKAD